MKFCFFGNISSVIEGQTPGGGELQIFLLAKALALKGHEVVIIDPYASKDYITPEGIKLMSVSDWNKGLKGLRMFLYRIPSLRKIFVEQKADYYYLRMRSFLNLIPYLIAKKNNVKVIQAISSDIDVLSAFKKYKYEYKGNFKILRFLTQNLPSDLVFNFLLKKSDFVVFQHKGQKSPSTSSKTTQFIFSNIIDLTTLPIGTNSLKNYFIYAGSLTMLKGVDNLLRLINATNDSISFLIVGLPKGKKSKEIYEELGKKKNVILKGRKNHKETLELISNAKALINTSYFEGFPNIYLEAWGSGVPVISLTVNPGDIIRKFKLGVCCNNNLDRMKHCIETNETDQFDKEELRSYVERFHDFKTAADRFLDAITPKLSPTFR